jgi:hypothetical protein
VVHGLREELDFPEAQRQFATAALYSRRDDGAGTVLSWTVPERRRFWFRFDTFPPGRYDDVLFRSITYIWSDVEGDIYTGSVQRTADIRGWRCGRGYGR